MATGNPDPPEVWIPMFLYYEGDRSKPKFTKDQILAPNFAITSGHCKLCDSTVTGNTDEHLRKHRKELTAYLAKRRAQAERAKAAGLKKGRGKKIEQAAHDEAADIVAEALAEGVNNDDDDD